MERGVYAQGWFARGHNYHPSLPPRRLKMAEDFADYRATMITWPSLGGGSISLPYLEDEAFAVIPARYRQYGFLKDSEFLDECRLRGVKAFSVIFSTQGWEFAAELNEAEDEILAMNELRGVGKRVWLGLREFTQNTYPRIWAPFEKYFPDGLTNSRGHRVTDLFQECCSRDIHGHPHHAHWLEVPAREQVCHFMDLNNPVWREYLKAVVRIHVDAGVDGIQFDEPDSPLAALQYGGSFSYDNMAGFTQHLQRLPAEQLPEEIRGRLDNFHYGDWLLTRGRETVQLKAGGVEGEVARLYIRFLQGSQAANFSELAGYVRAYAASKGRTVLVSSNLYDGAPWHDPPARDVDILVPEQRHTLYEQPGWMRFIAGFGGDKSVCISTNPYGGVMPELLAKLNRGRAFDRFRVMLYEAAALGVNMSVPYGAWMGSVIEDAVWAPHEETVEIQSFLVDCEHLTSRRTWNATALIYSTDSFYEEIVYQTLNSSAEDVYPAVGETGPRAIPFFRVANALALAHRPFDVVVYHDGVHREDDSTLEQLAQYDHVVVPDCTRLTAQQATSLLGFLERGGRVTVVGELGVPTAHQRAEELLGHPGTEVTGSLGAPTVADRPDQLRVTGLPRGALNIHRPADGLAALHLVNYDYDTSREETRTAAEVRVEIALPFPVRQATVHRPGAPSAAVAVTDAGEGRVRLALPPVGVYAVVELVG